LYPGPVGVRTKFAKASKGGKSKNVDSMNENFDRKDALSIDSAAVTFKSGYNEERSPDAQERGQDDLTNS